MIYDQKEVFEYYNKAKVLLSTSRHEGFANVYSQAAAMGCYIVSTDVGGADVASNNWQFGKKLAQEDSSMLAIQISEIISGDVVIDATKSHLISDISYSNKVNQVLLPQMGIL